jgi:hypothetical protein
MHITIETLLSEVRPTLRRIQSIQTLGPKHKASCVAELELIEFILVEARQVPESQFGLAVLEALDDVLRCTGQLLELENKRGAGS